MAEAMYVVLRALEDFAAKHRVDFEPAGEVGFGRQCVGFSRRNCYIDYAPRVGDDFHRHPKFPDDGRLRAPAGVEAYHKHECMAVLGEGDEAHRQLLTWVRHLEAQGEVEVVEYFTGHEGIQAIISGKIGSAIRFKVPAEPRP